MFFDKICNTVDFKDLFAHKGLSGSFCENATQKFILSNLTLATATPPMDFEVYLATN
jgi:hypothetical protein